MKKLVLTMMAGALLASCAKKPEACFITDKGNTDTKVNEVIHFDAACSSDNVDEYSWTFGDGGTAMGPQVMHKYEREGTYNVVLTVKNGSKDAVMTQTLLINR
jgi:PKD repeat protein